MGEVYSVLKRKTVFKSTWIPSVSWRLVEAEIMLSFSDSVTLSGEGEYNLNILNQIDVTQSFLGLPEEVRNCQNAESYVNCTTRHYLEKLKEKCGCLPLALAQDQVYITDFNTILLGSELRANEILAHIS